MRLYIIVDPLNHVFQLGGAFHFGLIPLAEASAVDFKEFRKTINDAWNLYQRSVLQPEVIQDIESIEALDKI